MDSNNGSRTGVTPFSSIPANDVEDLAKGVQTDWKAKASRAEGRELRRLRGIYEKVRGSAEWWIRYTDAEGHYHREKAGTKSMAIDLYRKRKVQALERKKLPERLRRRVVSFNEIADDALAYSKLHKRSYDDDCSRMKRLKEWFGNRAADSLSGHEMELRLSEIARTEKWAPSTFNHYRSLLMLCFREAQRAGKAPGNPARAIRHRKENNSRLRFLSRSDEKGNAEKGEYARLLQVIRANYLEHLPEFIFAVNTGLRLGSQYAATYEMLDLTRKELNLPRTKNDDPVHVPLNDAALAAIRSLPSWQERRGPIFRNLNYPGKAVLSNDHWFKPALKNAGISDFRWHDLRHTFASWLVQDGVPLDRVSKLLGHKSLMMTMRYAHLAPNQLHEDVARLVLTGTTVAPEPEVEVTSPGSYLQ